MSQIRSATPEDAPTSAGFQIAMASETEDRPLDPAVIGPGVQRGIQDPAKGRYWVAEEDGEVVGSLMVTLEWSDWRNGWIWWIQSVYVLREARGRGHYRALYDEVLREARAAEDVRAIRLYVEVENSTARKVYERLGMEETGYRLYETSIDGTSSAEAGA